MSHSTAPAEANRYAVWSGRVEPYLAAAAIAFLLAYAAPIIWPGLPLEAVFALEITTWATWLVFALDLVVRFVLFEDRSLFLRRHWFDLAVILLPLLRPLRLLRLVPMLRFLDRRATTGLRGRLVTYVAGGASLLGFCAALAVVDAERDSPDANILTFGDGLWWAATTMTSVGYGDLYPTTTAGRLAAVALMVGGIAILGTVTAALASWLVERIRSETANDGDKQVALLRAEIAELRSLLLAAGGSPASRAAGSMLGSQSSEVEGQ